MPELPEVEAFRRLVDTTSLGRRIETVSVLEPHVVRGLPAASLSAGLSGHDFEATARRGKYLFSKLSNGPWLVLHFGMTGGLRFGEAGERPPFTRVEFAFQDGHALFYTDVRRLGLITLASDPGRFAEQHRLGPDALDPALDAEEFARRLSRRPNTVMKTALLDQSVVAGLGNEYSDEVLFQARISPLERVDAVGEEESERLFGVMRRMLLTAVEDRVAGKELPDTWLIRHRSRGDDCPCGGKVERVLIRDRSTYFCPSCQKGAPGAAAAGPYS